MKFSYVSGRACLDFAGTLRHRGSTQVEELLTNPDRLSEWALEAGMVDAAIAVSADELAAAIELREAVYRVVTARLEHRPLEVADLDLLNDRASQPRLTPQLDPAGSISRNGALSTLLASLAADLLDLFAGGDIQNVKGCAHPDCTRLYVDSSRGKNRHWCGMATCGNKVKVQAFRARQRTAAGARAADVGHST
jgi:predicted RNA-binding Zn ribbon-like protein